jgi:hypothetical protein
MTDPEKLRVAEKEALETKEDPPPPVRRRRLPPPVFNEPLIQVDTRQPPHG